MTFYVYAMRDALTGYMQPTFEVNDAVAMRNFRSSVLNSRSGNLLNSDPQDFSLYKIGEFDSESAQLHAMEPMPILTGTSVMLESLKEVSSNGNIPHAV